MKNKLLIHPFIFLIKIYQIIFSPLFGSNCRYLPTCSEYTIESLKKFGILKGLFLSSKRILKCHPFGNKGFDPVPKNNKLK
tara:strand:+ start:8 stop:250 length:243 start_codon:yes stop_codon:yes gene_type:complete